MLIFNWIKGRIGLLSVVALTFGILTYLAVIVGEQGPIFLRSPDDNINPVLMSFRRNHPAIVEINFSELYGRNGQFQVLHPLLNFRNLKIQIDSRTCNDEDSAFNDTKSSSGQRSFLQLNPDDNIMKWEAMKLLLSSENFVIPEKFITTPPYLDEAGNSYAFNLATKRPPPYNGRDWIKKHLSFFKISELREMLKDFEIDDPRYTVISHLTESEIEGVIRGLPLVLTKDYLLLKDEIRLGFSPLSYWVYSIQDLNSDIKNSNYELSVFTPGAICLQHIGNGCWSYNSKHTMAYLYRYSVVILVLIGLIIFTFFGFYFKRLYERDKEQYKNRLALQVLSHEFRTPVTSMLLMTERLTKNQDRFAVEDQDLFTRMSGEIFKLQRIIEVSKTYLQTESHRVHLKYAEIPSINGWLADFIAESDLDIHFQPLKKDISLKADLFWLKFVLSNLVQNAFLHGKPPVFIRLQHEENKLRMTVEDQGQCDFHSLREMTDAFVKSNRSKGMGLGLNITKFILGEWGVELQFSNSPTSFSLVFDLAKAGEK